MISRRASIPSAVEGLSQQNSLLISVSREIGAETGSQLTASSATGGIFKDAPHLNAAKLYITRFLAKEQQSRLGSFSSRVDVPPPEGFQPITSYKIALSARSRMEHLAPAWQRARSSCRRPADSAARQREHGELTA
jgi:hypothetical protein